MTYFFRLSLALEVSTDILTEVSFLYLLSSIGKGSMTSISNSFFSGRGLILRSLISFLRLISFSLMALIGDSVTWKRAV